MFTHIIQRGDHEQWFRPFTKSTKVCRYCFNWWHYCSVSTSMP